METNWSGNYQYRADRIHAPETLAKVQELIRTNPSAHVLGTRHSFNNIADTTGDLISLHNIPSEITLDRDEGTATVSAHLEYGTVAQHLHENGVALHNLASLPHISVGGACATATHGSGVNNGNLATAVVGLDLLTGMGDRVSLTRDENSDAFHGAVVGLGALGVVTDLTLEVEPTFDVRQFVYEDLSATTVFDQVDEIMSSAYSVSLFTDYRDDTFNQVWVKDRLDDGASFEGPTVFFDAEQANGHRNPVPDQPSKHATRQMGEPGPWHRRLPHFRMDFTPSSGDELQTEYFIPLDRATEALEAVFEVSDQIAPHLFISEIRTVAADALWMSPAYKQPAVAIHFTWEPDWLAVREVLPVIERQLAPFDVRPHWGKLFTLCPETLKSRIQKLDDFRQLAQTYDPDGTFRNEFLDMYIF